MSQVARRLEILDKVLALFGMRVGAYQTADMDIQGDIVVGVRLTIYFMRCIGCPFSKDIKSELETLSLLEPSEYKRAQWLWKTVYDEYRRIGYRLNNQPTLFD